MAEDIEFRPAAYLVDGITYHGHRGLREWIERAMETWSSLHGSPRALAGSGDRLAVAIDLEMVGRASDVPLAQTAFVVYTLRAGKVAGLDSYGSEREAIEAV